MQSVPLATCLVMADLNRSNSRNHPMPFNAVENVRVALHLLATASAVDDFKCAAALL